MLKPWFSCVALVVFLPACIVVERRTDDTSSGQSGSTGVSCSAESRYPHAAEGDPTLHAPEVSLAGFDAAGAAATFSTAAFYEPCERAARLLVLRLSAAWCGPCAWHRDHAKGLVPEELSSRVTFVDVLLRDKNNGPADLAALRAWREDAAIKTNVALGPALSPFALDRNPGALPLVVLVDRRTMAIRAALHNPDPETVSFQIRDVLAKADGRARPAYPTLPLVDDRFTAREWDEVRAMTPIGPPPPDPSNAVADDPRAAAFGEQLFMDKGLEPDGSVACVGCHAPRNTFASPSVVPVGKGQGDRNTPTTVMAPYSPWLFWDGRADSTWMQALGPMENPLEMGSTRVFVAQAIAARYKSTYEAIFGALPPLGDAARFPTAGKPGDASWARMTEDDRVSVNRVLSNAGKAIAAFERRVRPGQNALDRYASGDSSALTAPQKDGLVAFLREGCVQCHHGPRLTDDAFHVVRFPTGRKDNVADVGREEGLASLGTSEFRRDGLYSDQRASFVIPAASPLDHGAFKTPSLRGVPQTGPYGHGGTLATLDEVLEVYARRGLDPADPRSTGDAEPWLVPFGDASRSDIRAFLEVLTVTPEY